VYDEAGTPVPRGVRRRPVCPVRPRWPGPGGWRLDQNR